MADPDLRAAAIVQDADDGRVLMLAWMDDEALRRTRETGEAWFWSRSRSELWHKGETSGQHARRRGDPRRLRRRRDPAPRPSGRPGLPHRLALVLRAVAVAAGGRAGEGAAGGLVRGRLLDAGPPPRAQGRRGGRRGGARRRDARATSAWSRSSPTSGSTPTCSSPRAGSTRTTSRPSSGAAIR